MPALADLNVIIGADISQLDKNLRQAQKVLRKNARALQDIGDGIYNKITIPFVAATAAGVKFSSDLESNFSKIQNLVGITGQSLDQLKSGVENLSGSTAKSQKELSDALFTVTSAGLRGSEALSVLEKAAKSSAVGLGDTGQIARSITAVLQAYGEENINAATAAETLFKTIKAGNLDAESLAPTLGKVLPIASALGVSFQELGANIAAFTKLGVSAPESITAIKAALSSILKPSEEGRKALASVGLTVEDLRKSLKENGLASTFQNLTQVFKGNEEGLAKVFGSVEGLANVLGTAGAQGEDYIAITKEMIRSTDFLEKGFNEASKTTQQTLTQSLVDLQNAAIKVGDVFAPVVRDIAKSISGAVRVFSNLDESTQKSILSMGAFAAATGVALKGAALFTRGLISTIDAMRGVLSLSKSTLAGIQRLDGFFNGLGKTVDGSTVPALAKLRTSVGNVIKAFKALNVATKLTIAGLAIGAVVGAVAAYNSLSRALDSTTAKQKALNEITSKAKASIAAEKAEVGALVKVLEDETASREKKQKALNQLKSTYPSYFSQLEIEDGKVLGLTTAYENLSKELLKQAKLRVASDRISEIAGELQNAEDNLDRLNKKDFTLLEKIKVSGSSVGFEVLVKNAENDVERLKKKADEATELYEKLFNSGDPAPSGSDLTQGASSTDVVIPVTPSLDVSAIDQVLADLEASFQTNSDKLQIYGEDFNLVQANVDAVTSALDKLAGLDISVDSTKVVEVRDKLAELNLELAKLERGEPPAVLESLPSLLQPISDKADEIKQKFSNDLFKTLGKGFEEIGVKAQIFGESFDGIGAKISLVREALQNLISQGFEATDPAIQLLIEKLQLLEAASAESFSSMQTKAEEFQESYRQIVEDGMQTLVSDLSSTIGQVIAGQASSSQIMGALLGNIASILGQLGKLSVGTAIAIEGIKQALTSLNPVAALAGGVALIALSEFVKSKAAGLASAGGSDVPALAQGGLASGPTLALVGDNPNAHIDPEVISPLSKLQGMLNKSDVMIPEVRLKGQDILVSFERAQRTRDRMRGF